MATSSTSLSNPVTSSLLANSNPAAAAEAAETAAASPPSAPNLISASQSGRPLLSFNSFNSFNIEQGDQTSAVVPDDHSNGKTFGLAGLGISVTLMVSAPSSAATHRALYAAYLSGVSLGLLTSIGLSAVSLITTGSPAVGWVQKRLINFTFFFVGLACFLRLLLALPLAYIGFAAVPVLFVLVAIVLYLLFGSKNLQQIHETGQNN